ncbi:MAG: hypothetical protein PHZ26_05260 [Candidatus Gracilibacteria bacterium]|nr:hypothetical protein [Candidatus Gracilibacteria bacterium]MDD2909125.1 hypothetical protein [Candidatus Gracilibacteria bacterium]
MIKCPYCAEEILEEAKICKHCQKKLTSFEAKNLIKKQIQENNKILEKEKLNILADSLKDKLEKYPANFRKKLKNDKNFLEKLKEMNDIEIEKDIFKRERSKNIKILWIISILILFKFPIIIALSIWLHPTKKEKTIFNLKEKIKNIKNHKLRIILTLIVIFFSYIIYQTNLETQKQEQIKQEQLQKENSTKILANFSTSKNFTKDDNIEISLILSNIKKLSINEKEIDMQGKNEIRYSLPLNLGDNQITIIGFNEDVKREIKKNIKRVSLEEFNALEKQEQEIIEAEKKRQEEIAKQEQERIEKENREKKIESQFSAWDGSHIKLKDYVKKNLKDPDSFEHIGTKYWILQDKDGTYYISVNMNYRAKNSFGGYVIENYKAFFDIDGNSIKLDSWTSFQ